MVAADPACRSEAAAGARQRARGSSATQLLGAASSRLCSKNQRPCRISSTTRGRCGAHLVGLPERGDLLGGRVLDPARRGGASSSSLSSSPSRACAARIVRRVASVGCAVRTSSSETCRAAARSASSSTPASRSRRNASASDSRGNAAPRARLAGGGGCRWCCSAMLASWKKSVKARRIFVCCSRSSSPTARASSARTSGSPVSRARRETLGSPPRERAAPPPPARPSRARAASPSRRTSRRSGASVAMT